MDCHHVKSTPLELKLELIGCPLRLAKDKHSAILEIAHDLLQLVKFLVLLKQEEALRNVRVGQELRASDMETNEITLELAGEGLDLLRPRCREHEGLAIGANLRADGSDLRLKAHVEHAVGLVEDKIGRSHEVQPAGLEEVDQTTWCGDKNLRSAELLELLKFGCSAIDACDAHCCGQHFVRLGFDLLS